jgi:hypothetical protein
MNEQPTKGEGNKGERAEGMVCFEHQNNNNARGTGRQKKTQDGYVVCTIVTLSVAELVTISSVTNTTQLLFNCLVTKVAND